MNMVEFKPLKIGLEFSLVRYNLQKVLVSAVIKELINCRGLRTVA
jgi:hypothetical protein